MTTLHLQPETAHSVSHSFKNANATLAFHLQDLAGALSRIDSAWQGGDSAAFCSELGSLLKSLNSRQEDLAALIARLEREIAEWEETDQRGASGWRDGLWLTARFQALALMPTAAGLGGYSWQSIASILPLTTAVSIGSFLSGIPTWLKSLLDSLFPPAPVVSPIPGTQPPPPAREEPEKDKLDISYDIAAQSQGNLYGSAACAPTSVSMVLDYWHNQDGDNQAISADKLIELMDKGDGTPGRGISLSKLDDELKDLGYDNTTTQVGASMDDLKEQLQEGPVIVTTGVKIVGPGSITSDVPRAVTGPGSVIHAMVVKGIGEETVVVNDPWSGSEMQIPTDTFNQMWTNGQNGLYAIQP